MKSHQRLRPRPWLLAALVSTASLASAEDSSVHSFKKTQLTDKFWCEGASFGDLNRDGAMDLVAGPYWYEGPGFAKRHEYYPARATFQRKQADGAEEAVEGFEGALGAKNAYSDNFFVFILDFDRDGWQDILIVGFPGQDTSWFENPRGKEGHWARHRALAVTDNESPAFTDLTGDGKPELVCASGGSYGYAEPDGNHPREPWKWRAISPNKKYHAFTHGMGVGDLNGDGRADLLEKDGWWEQPPKLDGDPLWVFHPVPFGPGGAQMYAYDVNGDGLSDVITSLEAHGHGLAWYEQAREGSQARFKRHVFMNKEPKENKYGIVIGEPHAIDLVDMDGDGLKDIVTGTRYWSHGRHADAKLNLAAPLYWFRLVREKEGAVDFVPNLIDNDSGVGTQIVAGDLNGDGLLDVVAGNKKGAFVLIHEKKAR